MRQKFVLFFALLLTASRLLAQDSLAYPKSITQLNAPLLVIKGDEIRRYPTDNFLEAVNGLFPWVFSLDPDPDKYLFLVNGNILLDPNSISLYDIEEVSFDRTRLVGEQYPIIKAGVFRIKTKQGYNGKPVINVDSRYGMSWSANNIFLPSTNQYMTSQSLQKNNSNGQSHSTHVSLASGTEKLHIYTSAEWQSASSPEVSERNIDYYTGNTNDTFQGKGRSKLTNLKAFLNLTYRFSDKVEAGITGNYFHGHTTEDSSLSQHSPSFYTEPLIGARNNLDDYHASFFVNWKPITHLQNSISLEYFGARNAYSKDLIANTLALPGTPSDRTATSDAYARTDQFLLRDRLSYQFFAEHKFKLRASVTYIYLHERTKYRRIDQINNSGGLFSSSGYSLLYYPKNSSINPAIDFNYNNLVSGYAGYSTFISKVRKFTTKASNRNTYAGLSLNLKNLLHAGDALDRLDISADFGDMNKDFGSNYWTNPTGRLESFAPAGPSNFYFGFGPANYEPPNDKIVSLQINSSFLQNRVQAGIAYSKLTTDFNFLFLVQSLPPLYLTVPGHIFQKDLAFYAAAKVVDHSTFDWNLRLNLVLPDTKYKVYNLTGYILTTTTYKMQAGMQHSFRFNRLTAQLNSVVGSGRQEVDHRTNVSSKKETELVLNYVSLAYDIPVKENSFFQAFSVFANGRNVLSNQKTKLNYFYDSYAGIGVNLGLK